MEENIVNYLIKFRKELEVQRYSERTVSAYVSALKIFFAGIRSENLRSVSDEVIENFIFERIRTQKISQSYQKHLLGSIKLFYKLVFSRNVRIEHLYPKRTEKKLPPVFSKNDVKRIIDSCTTQNTKQYYQQFMPAG